MGPEEERAAFERKIKEEPSETIHHLVFADWLDEHGDHEWAKLERCLAMLMNVFRYNLEGPKRNPRPSRLRGY